MRFRMLIAHRSSLIVLSCIIPSFLALKAHAQTLTYSSGSGFFINRDGYVVTNSHVIDGCGVSPDISLSGAIDLSEARLVARDEEHDLALLKTDALPSDAAHISTQKQPMRLGDPVMIMGYPGQSWRTGEAVTGHARILDTKGPSGEEKWLEFTDSLALGNSGGPLLDSSGNVVGVVTGKARMWIYNETAAREETVGKADIAITLPVLRQFLAENNVLFREADSGIYLSSHSIADQARRFVVNVRCKLEQ